MTRRHAERTTPPPVQESHWSTSDQAVALHHLTGPTSASVDKWTNSASVDKWTRPSTALEDQWTSLGKAPKVDLEVNTSGPLVNLPFTINSLKTGDYVEKTARLESIPFSRF